MKRNALFVQGAYYHVWNRGANRERIFFNTGNYTHLLRLFKKYRKRYQITIIAYCLMPNHYHILLRQDSDVPLSEFMQTVFNAYVQAVNKQQERTGTMFEGRFRFSHVADEAYLTHLCRYIHLNPVKARLCTRPEQWLFSNYQEWVGVRDGSLVEREFVETWFDSAEAYTDFVVDGFSLCEESVEVIRPYIDG